MVKSVVPRNSNTPVLHIIRSSEPRSLAGGYGRASPTGYPATSGQPVAPGLKEFPLSIAVQAARSAAGCLHTDAVWHLAGVGNCRHQIDGATRSDNADDHGIRPRNPRGTISCVRIESLRIHPKYGLYEWPSEGLIDTRWMADKWLASRRERLYAIKLMPCGRSLPHFRLGTSAGSTPRCRWP